MDLIERRAGARRHPWELARAAFVTDALRSHGVLARATRVLDIGSGDAWLAGQLRAQLAPGASIVCWDANYTDDDRRELSAEHPGMAFVSQMPNGPFDLVLLLDVLEHVPADIEFLSSSIRDLAAPGAYVLATVPAWTWLFSQRDRHLGHYRRYSNAGARAVLRRAGLHVLADGGLFHSLLPMRAVSVLIERAQGVTREAGVNPVEWNAGGALTRIISSALHAETRASLFFGRIGVSLPGLSYWALCRRQA